MKFKPSTTILFFLSLFLFIFFFIVKCLHFQRCDYTSDIISQFQLSRDWLLGKPLFYENCYGLNKLHNYFLVILMAPFTYLFSYYGLFIVLFGLVIGALYSVLRMMEIKGISFHSKFIFVILYTSPLSYFILHNENYGFHLEMLWFPLSLLFISSFIQNNKWYLFWALLIILVKEDSAIVLLCLFTVSYISEWTKKTITTKTFFIKTMLTSAACLLVLVAGLAWLKYMNHGGETRSGGIYTTFKEQPAKDILSSFTYLLQTRIQLTLFVLVIVFFYSGWKFTLGAILVSIPILMLNFLSGIFYYEEGKIMIKNFFSLMWAPRLSSYWGYWLSVLVLSLTHKPRIIIYPVFMRTLACLIFCFLVFKLQYSFIKNCEVTRFDIEENMKDVFRPNIEFEYHPEFKDAADIAKQLPAYYPVAPMYRMFGAFYKQDIVWLNVWQNAYTPPRMILASYNIGDLPDVSIVMKHPLFMLYKERLHIYTEAEDTIYVSRAGIKGEWSEVVQIKN